MQSQHVLCYLVGCYQDLFSYHLRDSSVCPVIHHAEEIFWVFDELSQLPPELFPVYL
ncbi:TPA: hypothetical protein HA265_03970 [Candidatus Woesearchaeota archaeon]|nr:hypothetical protein [Candidatus Woesearchaeota archaeon]